MDYLRLGELRLGVLDGVCGFEEEAGYNYASHDIATGKPVLQAIGETLSQITLTICLRAKLGHDIPDVFQQIDNLRRTGSPQLLVFADGVYKGNYVITRRNNVIIRTNASGTITEADFTLELLEHADRVVINRRNSESRTAGENRNRKVTEK